jgi:hypothetical protein
MLGGNPEFAPSKVGVYSEESPTLLRGNLNPSNPI